jgi:hypothetical protein
MAEKYSYPNGSLFRLASLIEGRNSTDLESPFEFDRGPAQRPDRIEKTNIEKFESPGALVAMIRSKLLRTFSRADD